METVSDINQGTSQPAHPVLESRLSMTTPLSKDTVEEQLLLLTRQVLQGNALTENLEGDMAKEVPFMEAGVDSITAIELQQSISTHFGISLPVSALYDYPTIKALSQYILEHKVMAHHDDRAVDRIHKGDLIPKTFGGSDSTLDTTTIVIRHTSSLFANGTLRGINSDDVDPFGPVHYQDGVVSIPWTRWDVDGLKFEPLPCRFASLVPMNVLVSFDHEYFRITPNEALVLDPHARALLILIRELITCTSLTPTASNKVGLYVGCMWSTEFVDHLQNGMNEDIVNNTNVTLGNTFPFLVGRATYAFGWQGPSMGIDTACSSSLVALNTASSALRQNDCEEATVAGVNALMSAQTMLKIDALRALSLDGRCKTFDSNADGYGRGEGFAAFWLSKQTSEFQFQIDQGDCGLGSTSVILSASAVNTAGRGSGLTAPNGPAQQALIVKALRDAEQFSRGGCIDVGLVSVHGTGTSLGDPIEVNGLLQATKDAGSMQLPIALTSSKSHVQHSEGAAGLAGALVALHALQSRGISFPLVGLRSVNPYVSSTIDGHSSPIHLPRQQAVGHLDSAVGTSKFSTHNIHLYLVF